MRTWSASRSAVEYTATASTSSSCSARITRTAISPLFATRTRLNIRCGSPSDRVEGAPVHGLELEEELSVLDRLRVVDVDRAHDPLPLGLHLVHQLHRLEDAERLAARDGVADLDERRGAGRGRTVERADHRALDADEVVVARPDRRERLVLRRRGGRSRRRDGRVEGAPDAHAHAVLFDRDLADPGLLHDAHDLTDALLPQLVDAACGERLVAARALPDRTQERLSLVAEEREQQQLLLTRGEALGLVA